MIIRSQNKEGIVIMDNNDCIGIGTEGMKTIIMAYNGDSKAFLGYYSTREKAIKVLDMICEQYQYCEECKYTGIGVSQPEFVFQMPQDSEV